MARIVMYCTAVCPYCVNAERLLLRRGVTAIEKIRVDLDAEQRVIMENRSRRRTVPQIFNDERHIGGFDDLVELDQAGGLTPLLQH